VIASGVTFALILLFNALYLFGGLSGTAWWVLWGTVLTASMVTFLVFWMRRRP
jgi:hypothetical protein